MLLTAAGARADDPRPFIRARLTPPVPPAIMSGQAVSLTITVYVPTFFSTAPVWPDTIEVPNAIARIDTARAVNTSERVGDQTFAGISHDYRVYPLAAGRITVPPVAINVSYAREGGRASPPVTVRSDALAFTAQRPPGTEPGERVFAASSFNITDHLSRTQRGLKVGDALTRTITMTADDSWSAMLPPVAFADVEGVSVYAGTPTADDKADERGGPNRAMRVESASYVFQRAGSVTLPGMSVRWWDETQQRLRTATVPEVTLDVAAGPATTSAISFADEEALARQRATEARAERRRRERLLLGLGMAAAFLVALVLLVRRFGSPTSRRVADAWQRAARSEPVYFGRVMRASRASDPRAAYLACLAWLDRIWPPQREPMTLERAAEIAGDPALVAESRALGACLFGRAVATPPSWSGTEFARLISKARPILLAAARKDRPNEGSRLPPLNPSEPGSRQGASYKRVSA